MELTNHLLVLDKPALELLRQGKQFALLAITKDIPNGADGPVTLIVATHDDQAELRQMVEAPGGLHEVICEDCREQIAAFACARVAEIIMCLNMVPPGFPPQKNFRFN